MSNRKKQIERIRELPDLLEAAVRGLSDSQLDTPYREGGWTIRQVVHHLADSHMNAVVRMKLILTEENPTLKTYDQNRWADLVDGSRAPVAPSLSLIRGLHQRWCVLLGALTGDLWTRKAFHPESGEVSLESLLETYARHGENHIRQITQLRSSRAW